MDGVADFHRRALLCGVVLIAGCGLLFVSLPKPKLPPVSELDGRYDNPCCASIELLNGRIIVGRQNLPFEMKFDKAGMYVLPEKYVGIQDGRRLTIGGGFPLKLRIDDAQRPSSIQLWDTDRLTTYDFLRTAPTDPKDNRF